ncbi:recombinase family protein [Bdellovibrio bacteriovorus]|uniref:recombinase family protein n=1 Tax=Bdellovibrio bacteriovorus TaxID=959 RepID=UPI0035A5879B
MKFGYARISTRDQNLIMQIDALKAAGCQRIFQDIASGAIDNREGLRDALESMKAGDTLVVYKMDRAARSLRHLIEIVSTLNARGMGFQSLSESIDTNSAAGRFSMHVFAALGEFERELIISRTNSGLAAARARGRVGGRPSKLTEQQELIAYQLFNERQMTVDEIAKSFAVSRGTIYRSINKRPEGR